MKKRITCRLDGGTSHTVELEVKVDTSGTFYAKLPQDFADLMEAAQLAGDYRGKGVNGNTDNVTAKTLEALESKVYNWIKLACERKEVSRELVIRYVIETRCHYVKRPSGELVPNGGYDWCRKEHEEKVAGWVEGTHEQRSNEGTPFGFLVYARPRYKITYGYPGGRTTMEYIHVKEEEDDMEKRYNLHFLREIVHMREPGTGFGERKVTINEVPYTEEMAAFFVNAIKAVWNINERVKSLNDPKVLLELVASGQKFLG
jgi:hypothetical protein